MAVGVLDTGLGKVNVYTVRFCNKPQRLTLSLTLTQIGVNLVNLTSCEKERDQMDHEDSGNIEGFVLQTGIQGSHYW